MIVALVAGCALALAPSAALASSGNVAETQALARATNTLVKASTPDVPRGLAAVRGYAQKVAAQCPKVAAGSPENGDSSQLDDEVVGAITTVGYHLAKAPAAAFEHAVAHLSWSNSKLTRAVHTFATKLAGLTSLATPNICGDVEAWVHSGFQTIPSSTTQFLARYNKVDTTAEEVPQIIALATPYGTPSDLPVLRRVERLEAQLGQAEADAVAYYTEAMNAMELNQ